MQSQDLILSAQKGDLQAYNRLVLEHQEMVYSLAYYLLPDPGSAEEVTQTTFLSAYQDLRQYRRGDFRVWLLQRTARVCKQKLTRNGFRHAYSSSGSPSMEECLRSLPADLRLALVLVDIAGLDYAEAATVLEVSRGEIQSRLALGRQYLITQMGVPG